MKENARKTKPNSKSKPLSLSQSRKKNKEKEKEKKMGKKQNNILSDENLRDSAATFHLITSNLGDSPTELRGPASPLSMPLIPPFSRVI